jgi:hypothetical protein
MNLACPNCQRMITIGDQFAGQMMQCPLCNGTFTAPMLPSTGAPPAVPLTSSSASKPAGEEVYSLSGAGSTSSPGANPSDSPEAKTAADTSRPSSGASAGSSPIPAAPGAEYTHRYIIWISPRVVPWIAPVALAVVFLFFFFPWRGVPLGAGGEPVGQSGWVEVGSGPLMIFYFLLYLLALALSIGSLLLTVKIVPTPPQIAHLVPWRSCIVASAVALAFLFLYIDLLTETYTLAWFRCTVWLHLLALIGLGLEYCLQQRGPDRALPRIDVLW